MSLAIAAGISTVLGAPLAAVPVGFAIHNTFQSFHPNSKLKKWIIRIQQISAEIASKGDEIEPKELEIFLKVLEL